MSKIQLYTKLPCPACKDGKIKIDPYTEDGVIHLSTEAYCPCCSGKGYEEKWSDLEDLADLLTRHLS